LGAWRRRSTKRYLVATTGTLLVFLASAKVSHNNDLVWLIPIYGATLGLLLTAGPAPAPAPALTPAEVTAQRDG